MPTLLDNMLATNGEADKELSMSLRRCEKTQVTKKDAFNKIRKDPSAYVKLCRVIFENTKTDSGRPNKLPSEAAFRVLFQAMTDPSFDCRAAGVQLFGFVPHQEAGVHFTCSLCHGKSVEDKYACVLAGHGVDNSRRDGDCEGGGESSQVHIA